MKVGPSLRALIYSLKLPEEAEGKVRPELEVCTVQSSGVIHKVMQVALSPHASVHLLR